MPFPRLRCGFIASCAGEIARPFTPMNSALRHEYLTALGLETWVVRGKSKPANPPRESVVSREAPLMPEAPMSREAPMMRETPMSREAPARESGVDWPELRARVAAC